MTNISDKKDVTVNPYAFDTINVTDKWQPTRKVSMFELSNFTTNIDSNTVIKSGQRWIYEHPSGGFMKTSMGSAFMNQKAFGGVVILNDNIDQMQKPESPQNSNMSYVFEPDRYVAMSIDKIKEQYGIDVKLNKHSKPKSPLISNKPKRVKLTASKAYDYFDEITSKLDLGGVRNDITTRNHPELYKEQEKVLNELQGQDNGFHLLSGEVGVGKTHIASAYINDYHKKNPDARVLIIEPIDGVKNKFKKLINGPVTDKTTQEPGYTCITSDTSALNKNKTESEGNWDLVVFDEFHKMDKIKDVSQYPQTANKMADNVLAMTGTVSNEYPEQIWSVTKNYISRYASDNGIDMSDGLYMGPYQDSPSLKSSKTYIISQMSSIRLVPQFFVEYGLEKNSVQLLRQDIEELGLEKRMPVNKYAAGIDLTPKDKLFYNLVSMRAKNLNMSKANQLDILDAAFNTNKKEFIIRPTNIYGSKNIGYQLVEPEDIDPKEHDLLYLGKHDQPFKDKKIDFIAKLSQKEQEKVLVYLSSNDYSNRVVDDLNKQGVNAEFIDTHEPGAVDKINDSTADVVAFDINPISEGIDLKANHVVWYSTPRSAGLDEQACGRITRLSSEQTEKNFYYLYHKTTIQEDITQNIIKTNNVNNIALKRDQEKTEEISL